MKALRKILIVVFVAIAVQQTWAAGSQVHELSWRERAAQFKEVVLQKVEKSWTSLKSWWSAKSHSTAEQLPAQSRGIASVPSVEPNPRPAPDVIPSKGSKIIIDNSISAIRPETDESKTTEVKRGSDEVVQDEEENDIEATKRRATVPLIPTPLLQSYKDVATKENQLPQIQQGTKASGIQSLKSAIKGTPAYSVSRQGHAAQGNLKRDKAGVANFDLMQTKKAKNGKIQLTTIPVRRIPKLDAGEEPTLSANHFKMSDLNLMAIHAEQAKPLQSPPEIPAQTTHSQIQKIIGPQGVVAAGAPRNIKETETLQNKIMTKSRISNWTFKVKPNTEIKEFPTKSFSENQLRMLAATLLLQRDQQCHMAIGLLYRLLDDPEYGREAQYQFANCAGKLGLPTQQLHSTLKMIELEDKEYTARVIDEMPLNWPYDSEKAIGLALAKMKNKKLISSKSRDKANYLMAKAAFESGQYANSEALAQAVSDGFEKYPEAQYILATSEYALGQSKNAINVQEKLLNYLERHQVKSNLQTLIRLNLGRIAYQDKQYAKSKEYFVQIDKNHPLWLEGLMEEGWAQLQSGDYAGAIGNMYSIHSPFFKNVFVPESYVIRTIGYLNICQYGDAYRSLTTLEQMYRPWLNSMQSYMIDKKDYYETVKQYLKSTSASDVDGLPHQVIREMARQKDFLNHQKAINNREDEMARFSQIEAAIIKDKADVVASIIKGKARIADLRSKIRVSKKTKNFAVLNQQLAEYRNLEGWMDFYRLKLSVHLDSRKAYAELRATGERAVARAKSELRDQVQTILGRHLVKLTNQLKQILDNNELLRYEVFSGSGENIRYQVAGGAVGRVPANVKPESKELQWDFDGEYWADEIGHYRSSLVNNCPEAKGNDQAKLVGGGQ